MNPRLYSLALVLVAASSAMAAPPPELPIFPADTFYEGLDTRLYPLGWASNGEHLAYLMARPDEAAGERNWELQIMNLVTDKVIHSQTFLEPSSSGIDEVWNLHEDEIEEVLRSFAVTRHPFALNPFPALLGRYRGDSYEVELERIMAVEPNFNYRGIRQLKLRLTKNGGDAKTVKDSSWTEFYPLAAGVTGYLLNPEKNRIAILMAFTQRGYEGPPHTRLLQFVGARVGERF